LQEVKIFGLKFSRIMRGADISRDDLREITGVQLPTISRYFNGQSLPRPSVLEKMIQVLRPEQSRELLDAYLRAQFPSIDFDQVLAGKAQPTNPALLQREKKPGKVSSQVDEAGQEAEREGIEKSIYILRELAFRDKSIAVALESLAHSFRPRTAQRD
jgi:transcriptional regulator with XRE-family HTH domain